MRPGGARPACTALLAALLLAAGCAARTPAAAPATTSPTRVAADSLRLAFDAAPASLTIWSAQFVWADTGEVIFERQPDLRLLPASNMKLVTLAAAAQRLGWDHRFTTTVSASATPTDGVLPGPLEVRGGGDPTFGWPTEEALAQMRALAAGVRAQGVVRVEGGLVGDADAFGRDRYGDNWSWDDLPAAYAAPYSGLTFHENTVRVVVTAADAEGQAAHVRLEPDGSGLRVDADVQTTDGAVPARVTVERDPARSVLVVRGAVPQGATPWTRFVSVPAPASFFLQTLRVALALEGVDVIGPTRVAALPTLPEDGTPAVFVTHHSAPLSDVAVRFMKESQNLYGEALQRALAPGRTGTLAERRRAVDEALTALGVATGDLQVADGSGLSRRNFVSARTLVRLLQALNAAPHRDHVRRALPIAGVDGTLERRMTGTACAGQVRAKTGTLSHARALSGYLTTPSGREIIFSVLANNHLQPTADVDAVVDGALVALCAGRNETSSPVQ